MSSSTKYSKSSLIPYCKMNNIMAYHIKYVVRVGNMLEYYSLLWYIAKIHCYLYTFHSSYHEINLVIIMMAFLTFRKAITYNGTINFCGKIGWIYRRRQFARRLVFKLEFIN